MTTAQKPLTGTPKPALDWTRDQTPASTNFDDIYFSVDGGLEETRNVFLKGNNLPDRWRGRDLFIIGELGFGSGLNFLATWESWQQTAAPNNHLHFISIEAFPWNAEDLQHALRSFPQLATYTEPLINNWPGRVKGVHRLHFGNVHLTLMHMDVKSALTQYEGPGIDAWFLDGFSPAKNPEMWSPDIMKTLASLSNDGATIGTFTVAGNVRRGLQSAGFDVERKPGFGRKRHRMEAVFKSETRALKTKPSDTPPVIIGGGIAGASVAKAFARRNIKPILIDTAPDLSCAASGNPAALVMPRLDLQDRPESRFFLNAYLYATRVYQDEGHVLQTGAVQLAKSKDEQSRFEKIAAQSALSKTDMRLISNDDSKQFLGLSLEQTYDGLVFPRAQTIDPKATIKSFVQSADIRSAKVNRIGNEGGEWVIYAENGVELARTSVLIVSAGADILNMEGLAGLPVRFTRGQISWGPSDASPAQPVTFGGYALKYKDGVMLGATHEHVGQGQINQTRPEDDHENIKNFEALIGHKIELQTPNSRAGVRVTTKDTLPISTQMEPGLFVISGLGSRGFMMAPLLGEALVCEALGEPSPISSDTKTRFGTREKI